jgi:hypothetical protein
MNYPDNGGYAIVAYVVHATIIFGYAAFLIYRARKHR